MRSLLLRRVLAAGAAGALLAACSSDSVAERAVGMVEGVEGVEIDSEDGSVSVKGEDGETFDMDIDEDGESSTITTEDSTITTGEGQEFPPEIAAVFDPPEGYQIGAVSDSTSDGNRIIMAQGEIEGEWQALLDDLEARARAGDWDEVTVSTMAAGAMGGISATRGDAGEGLNITLLQDEGSATAMLSVLYAQPVVE